MLDIHRFRPQDATSAGENSSVEPSLTEPCTSVAFSGRAARRGSGPGCRFAPADSVQTADAVRFCRAPVDLFQDSNRPLSCVHDGLYSLPALRTRVCQLQMPAAVKGAWNGTVKDSIEKLADGQLTLAGRGRLAIQQPSMLG